MIEVMRVVNWSLFFLALAAAGAAGAYVGWMALHLMRRALEIQRGLTPMLDGLAQRSGTAVQNAESVGEHVVEIEAAAQRLEESAARLSVLLGAMSEANRRWKRVTGFVR